MAKQTFMAETVDVSYYDGTNAFIMPAVVLGEVKFSDKDDTVTIETQGGKFPKPANKPEGQVAVEVYLPNITYLGPLFGDSYTASTDNSGGKLVNRVAACTGTKSGVLHIHPVCNADDSNDMHFFNVIPMLDSEITFNEKGDPQKETVTFLINSDDSGQRYFRGKSDVTKKQKYVPATNTWTAVA